VAGRTTAPFRFLSLSVNYFEQLSDCLNTRDGEEEARRGSVSTGSPCPGPALRAGMEPMGKVLSTEEKLQKLKLFNEKAEVLRRRNFVKQVFRPDHGVTVKFNFDPQAGPLGIESERRGADEESLHAFAITFRFFVQPGDGITIEQIAEIYESLPVEDRAKQSARNAADSLKSYLDSTTEVAFNGKTITRQRLFDVFMYGNMAHAKDDKRLEYESWMQHPLTAAILPTFLEETIASLTNCILSFHEMNERTIQQLS
jgi:hypothetical protein